MKVLDDSSSSDGNLDQKFFDNLIRQYLEKNDHGLYQSLKTLKDDNKNSSTKKYVQLYLTAIKNNINRLKKHSYINPPTAIKIILFSHFMIGLSFIFAFIEFSTHPNLALGALGSAFSLIILTMCGLPTAKIVETNISSNLITLLEYFDTTYIKINLAAYFDNMLDDEPYDYEPLPDARPNECGCKGYIDIVDDYAYQLEKSCPKSFSDHPDTLYNFTMGLLSYDRDLSNINPDTAQISPPPRSYCTDSLYHLFYDDSSEESIDLESLEVISDNELYLLTQ